MGHVSRILSRINTSYITQKIAKEVSIFRLRCRKENAQCSRVVVVQLICVFVVVIVHHSFPDAASHSYIALNLMKSMSESFGGSNPNNIWDKKNNKYKFKEFIK